MTAVEDAPVATGGADVVDRVFSFWHNFTHICCVLKWSWSPSTMDRAGVNFLKEFRVSILALKNELLSWSKVFLQTLF